MNENAEVGGILNAEGQIIGNFGQAEKYASQEHKPENIRIKLSETEAGDDEDDNGDDGFAKGGEHFLGGDFAFFEINVRNIIVGKNPKYIKQNSNGN